MYRRRGQVGERWQATSWREGGGGQAGPRRPATVWRPGVAPCRHRPGQVHRPRVPAWASSPATDPEAESHSYRYLVVAHDHFTTPDESFRY